MGGVESKVVRSQYEEDRLIGNHTSVWGSRWSEGRWGYKCCHSTMKQSYCTGDSGKKISNASLTLPPPNDEKKDGNSSDEEADEEEDEPQKTLVEIHQDQRSKTEKTSKKKNKKKKKMKKKSKKGKKEVS